MAPWKALLAVAAVAAILGLAMGANYDVGPSGQWDQTSDYKTWAASKRFDMGDTLTFKYGSTHDVVVVTKANYDACSINGAINTYTGGTTVIRLNATGKQYFICGTPGHCSSGMKVEIDVVAGAATPPASPPGSSPTPPGAPSPGTPTPPSPGASAPPPGQSAANTLTARSKSALVFGLGLLMLLLAF